MLACSTPAVNRPAVGAPNLVITRASTTPYWIQTAMIAAYAVWLVVFYVRSSPAR
jgi:hypothetical protein